MKISVENLKTQLASKEQLSGILNILNQVTFDLHKKGMMQWEYPWSEKEVLDDIELNRAYIVTANEQVIATFFVKEKESLSTLALEPRSMYLNQIAILPEYQGQNIGSYIIGYAKDLAGIEEKALYLDCWAGNDKLIEFYERNGFENLGSYPEDDYFVSIFKFSLERGKKEAECKIQTVIKNLNKHNMAGYFVNDKKELIDLLKKLIPKDVTVGCGDSVTLEETGVFDFLRNGNYIFYDKYQPGLTSAEKRELYLKNFSAHTLITGTNAVTMDGKIFNIDGNGSRVAPMIYGPEQVILVVGVNKIVENVEAAINRTRQIAAPLDAIRLGKETPCVKLGKCIDCNHPQRICNDFVLITGQFQKDRIKVVIVNQTLGY